MNRTMQVKPADIESKTGMKSNLIMILNSKRVHLMKLDQNYGKF